MNTQQIQNSPTPHENFPSDGRLLHRKIENINSLVSSLYAAVEDLESVRVPPLNENFDFYREVRRFETNLIKSALRISGGSQVKAAALLKMNATTLNAKMKALKLLRK